jgi:hypothetical protein
MGRIIASVTIENPLDREKKIRCDAFVDTGSSHMTLPKAWKDRLGKFVDSREVQMETADQKMVEGEVCGPVRLQIEGFPWVATEVAFIDMEPQDGDYEPLLGYLPLEHSQAAVDMLGHRLVFVKHLDLK